MNQLPFKPVQLVLLQSFQHLGGHSITPFARCHNRGLHKQSPEARESQPVALFNPTRSQERTQRAPLYPGISHSRDIAPLFREHRVFAGDQMKGFEPMGWFDFQIAEEEGYKALPDGMIA